MTKPDSDVHHSSLLVEVVLALIRVDFATVIAKLILPHLPKLLRRPQGLYEVLEYEAKLELRDDRGHDALITKRQRVRFLQDNIIAYQDQAWGDGFIFADYQCSPGIAVDRYRDGNKYRILISLREAKNRGDIIDFHIQRAVKEGFVRTVEDFQVDIDHPTRKLKMFVVFPQNRSPKQVKLIEQKTQRRLELDADNSEQLPDGRWQVRWETDKPKLYAAYLLHWEW